MNSMSRLRVEQVHVTFREGIPVQELALPRRYTLTHSDVTGDRFLTIDTDYDQKQISGLYTRLMRDEILAEWKDEGGKPTLHVYCHVSGGLALGSAGWRYDILRGHMRSVIETLRYGDRECIAAHPELDMAKVWVHFVSSHAKYNQVEDWGILHGYG
jgi:hypothetical protein